MACPLWGDSSLWGDGDLWCRAYGSQRAISDPIDSKLFHRVSLKLEITNGSGFVLDRMSALVRQQQDQAYTHEAFTDVATLSKVSLRVEVSNNSGFVINQIVPYVNLKKHDPIG